MIISKENWVEWLQLKGLNHRSISQYNNYFEKLNPEKINPETMLEFLKRYNNGVSRAMIKNLIYFVRTSPNIPDEIKKEISSFEVPRQTGRKKKRILKVLTKEQVHALAGNMRSLRDRYMVLLTFYLGLRVAELLSLKISSFNWETGKVRVIGKGNKERPLPLVPELQERVARFINSNLEKNPDFDVLFPMSERRWQIILASASKKLFGEGVNPHLLRHSCGSYLHQRGLTLKEIAEFLGHASVNTAQIYVHLDKRQLDSKVLRAFR